MRYINIKTGAVIDTPCVISGGDWIEESTPVQSDDKEPIEEAEEVEEEAEKAEEAKEPIEEAEEDTIDLSQMTVAELKRFAAEAKIDIGKVTKKDDIIAIIAASDAVEVE